MRSDANGQPKFRSGPHRVIHVATHHDTDNGSEMFVNTGH